MTDRTELRALLEAYRTAPNTDAAVDAYQECREAAVNALEPLLDQLDAAEDALNDAVLYENDARDALARQTPFYLAAKAALARVRELHRESRGSMSALYPNPICECGKDYPCPTRRALDATPTGGES